MKGSSALLFLAQEGARSSEASEYKHGMEDERIMNHEYYGGFYKP